MNKFDERRRALLAGKIPPLWIYREGSSSLESGFSFYFEVGSATYTNGYIYLNDSGYFKVGIRIINMIDDYSKLKIECRCPNGASATTIGYSNRDSHYSSGYTASMNAPKQREVIEFDISSATGTSNYIKAHSSWSKGSMYIYNIWLE